MSYKKSLSHIAMFCNDMQKTFEFYKELGIEHLYSITSEDGIEWCIFMKISDGQYIELQQVDSKGNPHPHPKDAKYYGNQSMWHYALETDDLESWIKDILSKGIQIWKDPDKIEEVKSVDDVFYSEDGIMVVWVIDPDGNPFEIQQVQEDSPRLK